MPGVYSPYGIYLPTEFLVWLSSSAFRLYVYRLQEFHALFRIAHILSMAIFFGSILLLDLRLFGLSRDLALRQFAPHVLPWTYASFCVAMVSGIVLFLFDPIQLASHTWFLPKLVLIALGVVNAAIFRRGAWDRALGDRVDRGHSLCLAQCQRAAAALEAHDDGDRILRSGQGAARRCGRRARSRRARWGGYHRPGGMSRLSPSRSSSPWRRWP